ncbi:hypothetical protein HYPSUDRAFT_802759 [Hypholoma sublateritium FD-334 SS-4]|uniref:RanBP2-type domain-containing protein n=1 Tax=Hypholoma sublateritium (strain FD-334 SS-4) TaxID=945553 RepID=A0A0D2Q8W9_HYPSF|nr:hypothetical protein HYPSUDRAFT_802759 [Hypholoma sublateritium FD-334 SS-4]
MSAIRNNTNRAEERKKKTLPYARSNSVTKFFLRVLGYPTEEPEQPELPVNAPKDYTMTDQQASASASRTQDNGFLGTPPRSSFSNRPPLSQDFQNFSPMGARDPPPSFLAGPPRSIINNISNKSTLNPDTKVENPVVANPQTTPEKSETFRFTFTTPRHETPSISSANSTPTTSAESSTKKLMTRNPNGVYRWEGAGSAKRSRPRNRYASPAFGASPAKSERLVMKDNRETVETDHKRRKTAESAASTSEPSSSSLPFPLTTSPPTPKANGTPVRPAAVASARLRTPAKPTAPVVPSPLRQAWSDASPPSSRDDSRGSPAQQIKPTKTANFMADLIKETTPVVKPDLSNPYQTASPVGKVGPPRRGARRPRATGRPALPSREEKAAEEKKQKEKEKLDAVSSQAIIEATVPKGSKRSRPPANFEKPSEVNGHVNEENRVSQYQVEEPEDDGSSRASKKSKPTLNGNGRPSSFKSPPPVSSDITIEEIGDVPMSETNKDDEKVKTNGKDTTHATNGSVSAAAAASTNALTSRASFSALKSIPREPSKLRFSFQAEGSAASPSSPAAPPAAPLPRLSPPAPAPLQQPAFAIPSSNFSFSFKANEKEAIDEPMSMAPDSDAPLRPPTEEEIKAQVKAMDPNDIPEFSFTLTAISILSSSAEHVRARSDVKVLPPSSLPTFNFLDPVVESPSGFKFSSTPSTSYNTPKLSPPKFDLPPVKAFDFAAAGMKVEVKKDIWTCSICSVTNKNSAVQCVACESPAPSAGPTSKPVETLRPSMPAAPVVKGFDFAAAGFKMATPNKDTWICSECTLSNPNSASTCGPCGADRK